MNRKLTALLCLSLSVSTLALAMPQKVTTERLIVTVYPDESGMREALEQALKDNGVAVAAVAGKDGMLKLHFWEKRTKHEGVPVPSVTLSIPGVAEDVPLQPLSYVDRANMFEFTIHQDRLGTAYFVIQTRMNHPEQGDYAWRGVFQLKEVPTNPSTATE
jgi:hypothetical protein